VHYYCHKCYNTPAAVCKRLLPDLSTRKRKEVSDINPKANNEKETQIPQRDNEKEDASENEATNEIENTVLLSSCESETAADLSKSEDDKISVDAELGQSQSLQGVHMLVGSGNMAADGGAKDETTVEVVALISPTARDEIACESKTASKLSENEDKEIYADTKPEERRSAQDMPMGDDEVTGEQGFNDEGDVEGVESDICARGCKHHYTDFDDDHSFVSSKDNNDNEGDESEGDTSSDDASSCMSNNNHENMNDEEDENAGTFTLVSGDHENNFIKNELEGCEKGYLKISMVNNLGKNVTLLAGDKVSFTKFSKKKEKSNNVFVQGLIYGNGSMVALLVAASNITDFLNNKPVDWETDLVHAKSFGLAEVEATTIALKDMENVVLSIAADIRQRMAAVKDLSEEDFLNSSPPKQVAQKRKRRRGARLTVKKKRSAKPPLIDLQV
jgi:hypothetical protein